MTFGTETERRYAVEQARARLQAHGIHCSTRCADLFDLFIAGKLSLLELRYAIEARYYRRRTPACLRLWSDGTPLAQPIGAETAPGANANSSLDPVTALPLMVWEA